MLNLGFWQNRVQLLFLLKVRRSRFPVISSDKDFEGSASVNYAGVLKQRKFDFQYQMRNEHPTVIVKIYLKAQACKLFPRLSDEFIYIQNLVWILHNESNQSWSFLKFSFSWMRFRVVSRSMNYELICII